MDRSGSHDACSCPDFLGNEIGTCKHLGAVRRAIASVPALRRAFRELAEAATAPTLTVDAVGGLSLRPVGKWTERALARCGLAQQDCDGANTRELGSARNAQERRALEPGLSLTPGWHADGVRVVYAAAAAAEQIRARQMLATRRREVRRAFERGRLGVDVLSLPLFPYQRDGLLHLVSAGRALLADDMGLGKTIQAIGACELLRARAEATRILVVTVASLKHQWAREIERFTGERAVVVSGGAPARRRALQSDAPYRILNYELTWRELSQLQSLEADVVIYDEAQRAKNFRTKTATTLRSIPARFVFVLTGTPVENRLDDLYSLLQLIDPAVLGPLWRFNFAFHQQNQKGKIFGYKNLSALRDRIAPVVLRRRKEEVLTQLPPLTEQTRYTPLSKEQRELEAGYRADAAILLALAERRPLTEEEHKRLMMLLLKARQACSALELCDRKRATKPSPKLDEFAALISEIVAQGSSKVLVFSEWVEMLKLSAARLDALGIGHAVLHGGVPADKRPALLDRFRETADLRVLLSTDAGGVGLNLQVANYVVHLDLPWNPARLDQRTARAHRLGQTRGVCVTYLCAEEGIERGIEGTLAGKRAVRSAALDPASDVDALEAPSFSVFLRQIREVLEGVAAGTTNGADHGEPIEPPPALLEPPATASLPAGGTSGAGEPRAASEAAADGGASTREAAEITCAAEPTEAMREPAAAATAGAAEASAAVSPSASAESSRGRRGAAYAHNRLQLARVVLDAGFTADAVRAAYDALASAVAGLVDGAAPESHAALVAAIYRDLLPAGRLAPAAHGVLARLHDLATLDSHGVDVDLMLAGAALGEAEEWVARLASAPAGKDEEQPQRPR